MQLRALPAFTHDYGTVVIEMLPFVCSLSAKSHAPHAHEHLAVKWVALDSIDTVDLAPADWPVVAMLREIERNVERHTLSARGGSDPGAAGADPFQVVGERIPDHRFRQAEGFRRVAMRRARREIGGVPRTSASSRAASARWPRRLPRTGRCRMSRSTARSQPQKTSPTWRDSRPRSKPTVDRSTEGSAGSPSSA